MRRLARYTLNALTVLSLLLCVATVALWVQSYFTGYERYVGTSDTEGSQFIARKQRLIAARGAFQWYREVERIDRVAPTLADKVRRSIAREDGNSFVTLDQPREVSHPGDGALGFDWYHLRSTDARTYGTQTSDKRILTLPLWFPALLFGTLPTYFITRRLRRGPRRWHGRCPRCNYDLRATPDRCPECGAVKGVG